MKHLFVLTFIAKTAWGKALEALKTALVDKEREAIVDAYVDLFHALSERGVFDLQTAVAEDLLFSKSVLSETALKKSDLPKGLVAAAQQDLETLLTQVNRNWQAEASKAVSRPLPSLKELAPFKLNPAIDELIAMFESGDANWLLKQLIAAYRTHGTGDLARFEAFQWTGKLSGIAYPLQTSMQRLVALEHQLEQLSNNTLAFLAGKPAHHTLLYGPRGSGKSTAVRTLVKHYGAAGLRLIELAPQALGDLPEVVEQIRFYPHKYIIFVDDLSFEAGDTRYQPLKTLLEGSLTERPDNVLIYATSNRRHLIKEQFSDRPDPLNDDVHAWDTQNERLALADRFGLTITFPNATQTRYLEVVRGLVKKEGLEPHNLEQRAIQFADWGNGYSGRTAQQFVDALNAELV